MPRGRKAGFSIFELERLLQEQRTTLQKLTKRRAEAQKKLDEIDREIESLGGGKSVSRTAGGRVRNELSLVEALEGVLKGKGAMKVGDIEKAVLAAGYRSSSPKFRGIVNQALIREKQFIQTGRGTYAAK